MYYQKVADLIVSKFSAGECEIRKVDDISVDVICPYFPSSVSSKVSPSLNVGVFPIDENSVMVNIYKL